MTSVMSRVIETQDYQIIGPTLEPLDLEEVKKQRRFTSTSIDTLFDMWMGASRQDFESETGVQLLTATREYALDATPCADRIEIPRPPLRSIVSITYDDDSGVEQTFDSANYVVLPRQSDPQEFDTFPTPGYVALVSGASWPTVTCRRQALRIRYICGFGDAPGAVPELIQYALFMFVGTAHKYAESLQELRGSNLSIPGVDNVMMRAKWNARRVLAPRTYSWPV
jgi:uncharacterized phiE125 gp8 family phage protein